MREWIWCRWVSSVWEAVNNCNISFHHTISMWMRFMLTKGCMYGNDLSFFLVSSKLVKKNVFSHFWWNRIYINETCYCCDMIRKSLSYTCKCFCIWNEIRGFIFVGVFSALQLCDVFYRKIILFIFHSMYSVFFFHWMNVYRHFYWITVFKHMSLVNGLHIWIQLHFCMFLHVICIFFCLEAQRWIRKKIGVIKKIVAFTFPLWNKIYSSAGVALKHITQTYIFVCTHTNQAI